MKKKSPDGNQICHSMWKNSVRWGDCWANIDFPWTLCSILTSISRWFSFFLITVMLPSILSPAKMHSALKRLKYEYSQIVSFIIESTVYDHNHKTAVRTVILFLPNCKKPHYWWIWCESKFQHQIKIVWATRGWSLVFLLCLQAPLATCSSRKWREVPGMVFLSGMQGKISLTLSTRNIWVKEEVLLAPVSCAGGIRSCAQNDLIICWTLLAAPEADIKIATECFRRPVFKYIHWELCLSM